MKKTADYNCRILGQIMTFSHTQFPSLITIKVQQEKKEYVDFLKSDSLFFQQYCQIDAVPSDNMFEGRNFFAFQCGKPFILPFNTAASDNK